MGSTGKRGLGGGGHQSHKDNALWPSGKFQGPSETGAIVVWKGPPGAGQPAAHCCPEKVPTEIRKPKLSKYSGSPQRSDGERLTLGAERCVSGRKYTCSLPAQGHLGPDARPRAGRLASVVLAGFLSLRPSVLACVGVFTGRGRHTAWSEPLSEHRQPQDRDAGAASVPPAARLSATPVCFPATG